jgi:steroid delta-isomerase-like uncharacterized protein
MSIEENKAVLRRIIEELWYKKNLASVDELIDKNWVYHGAGGQEFKGTEGFKHFVTMFTTAFPDFNVTIDDMVAEGDKVVSRMTARGTHQGNFMGIAPTGKKFAMQGITIHRIANGKEAESWQATDQLGMMQQIGAISKQ